VGLEKPTDDVKSLIIKNPDGLGPLYGVIRNRRSKSMSVPKNVFWFEILLYAALTLDALSVALQNRGALSIDVANRSGPSAGKAQ
jgi:hypothetical protein